MRKRFAVFFLMSLVAGIALTQLAHAQQYPYRDYQTTLTYTADGTFGNPVAQPTATPPSRRAYTNPGSVPPEVETIWSSPAPQPTATPTPTPKPDERIMPYRQLKPFLVLPFRKSDQDKLSISEGDIYSKGERDIHGEPVHFGTDINAPENTKLYAPCTGIAKQGRNTHVLRDSAGNPILYKGKMIGFGLGNFVQIQCEEAGVYVMLGHMKTVDSKIPGIWSIVQPNGDITPNGRLSQLNDNSIGVKVKVGDFIGTVGCTGLGWGDDAANVYAMFYWDDFHVHLEVYERVAPPGSSKDKKARWDPMGWYSSVDKEKRYAEFRQSRSHGLFLEDKYRRIRFAK